MRIHNFMNSFKSKKKDNNRVDLVARISILTLLELRIDLSDKFFRIVILNFGYETRIKRVRKTRKNNKRTVDTTK